MLHRMLPRCLLSLLILSLLGLLPGCAARHYRKGNDAMDEGRTAEAIQHYARAVKGDPGNADYLFALGQAYLREGIYPRAITAFTKAAEIASDRADLLEQLAFAYVKTGEIDAAIDVYWRLFALQKNAYGTFERIRPLLEKRGRYAEATDAALLASKGLRFDPGRLSELGREYQTLGHEKEAEKLYQRALELNPKQPALWRTLGEIRLRANNGPGAAEAFGQAYKLDPQDDQAALGTAEALRRIGQTDDALRIFEQVSYRNPEPIEPRIAMTELYLALGRVDAAVTNAREAFVRQPEDPTVQALKGAAHLAKGEYDKAVYALDRASRSETGTKTWVTRMMGDAFVGLGERATARQYYTRALTRNAEDGAAYLGLCRLDLEDDREEQGIDRCQKAMKFAPELRDDAVGLMTAYYEKLDRLQKAAEVEAKAPPPPKATRRSTKPEGEGRTGAKVSSQQLAQLRELQKELQAIPEDARSGREWFELGEVSLKLEDMATAETALTRAWQADPANLAYRKRMARLMLAKGSFDSALVHFKEIVGTDERDVEARYALVQAYLGRGSAGDAVEVLKELRELDPDNPRVYELTAESYFDLGMQAEGEKFQKLAVEKRRAQK